MVVVGTSAATTAVGAAAIAVPERPAGVPGVPSGSTHRVPLLFVGKNFLSHLQFEFRVAQREFAQFEGLFACRLLLQWWQGLSMVSARVIEIMVSKRRDTKTWRLPHAQHSWNAEGRQAHMGPYFGLSGQQLFPLIEQRCFPLCFQSPPLNIGGEGGAPHALLFHERFTGSRLPWTIKLGLGLGLGVHVRVCNPHMVSRVGNSAETRFTRWCKIAHFIPNPAA